MMPSTTTAFDYGAIIVRLENVSLRFGDRVILRDISATIRDIVGRDRTIGQIVGFLGPSGIGKTQLCRIIAGLQEPDSGRVLLGEQGEPTRPGMVGFVAQSYPLRMNRRVLGNVALAARGTREERHQAAWTMLERFGLAEHANHYPAQLSGGQRQRVAIAQQLLCSEHFIIMDEPFSGLDPNMSDATAALLRETADQHSFNTVIVVTHDVSAAVAVADTIWLMGHEVDTAGQRLPGARLVGEVDLIERGLAWHADVRELPAFAETVRELRARFRTL